MGILLFFTSLTSTFNTDASPFIIILATKEVYFLQLTNRLFCYTNTNETGLHSNRMRTTRLLPVSQHALHRGEGGIYPEGCLCGRPPRWTEWQTDVKTLPCRNFVAGGKDYKSAQSTVGGHDNTIIHYIYFSSLHQYQLCHRDASPVISE